MPGDTAGGYGVEAKMHVDGNSHGLSYIISLLDYTGRLLWVYDPAIGTGMVEVRKRRPGWRCGRRSA